jgi:cytochrome c biogenesis protein CcmG/thiol:disulfide interchange protein DsbE
MLKLRWATLPALVIPVGWLLFQSLNPHPRGLSSPLIGRPAPAFELASMDGRTIDSSTLRGRVVLVNFWASWCFDCIAEHAVLLEAQEQYGPDLVIIGVLYQDTVEDALAFLARYGDGGWPNLLDADGMLAIDYGVTGVPETFFIGSDGIVRYKQYGAVTQAVIDANLPTLVADANSSSHERFADAVPRP